jgi:hypothetical protein
MVLGWVGVYLAVVLVSLLAPCSRRGLQGWASGWTSMALGFAGLTMMVAAQCALTVRFRCMTDERGRKIAAQIDLRKHRSLWEDIADVLVSRSRRGEKCVPLAAVKARLVKSGKLGLANYRVALPEAPRNEPQGVLRQAHGIALESAGTPEDQGYADGLGQLAGNDLMRARVRDERPRILVCSRHSRAPLRIPFDIQ